MGRSARLLGRHLKGHVFLFERRPAPDYGAAAGLRLLLIFVLLEGVLGPRLSLFGLFGWPAPPAWLRVPIVLALALLLVRFVARVRPAQIGLHAWGDWSLTEKSYFVQALLIANVVFVTILADQLRAIVGDSGLWRTAAVVGFTNLFWGFHQELMYRGILQTELVRRWGPAAGIFASNLLFTFGPLHFYHFLKSAPGTPWPTMAGIFAIGLLFAVLFRRSGNLVMIGILHGLGNAYMDGLGNVR